MPRSVAKRSRCQRKRARRSNWCAGSSRSSNRSSRSRGRLWTTRSRMRARTSLAGFGIELDVGMRKRAGTLDITPKALKRLVAYECALFVTRLCKFENDERVASPDQLSELNELTARAI